MQPPPNPANEANQANEATPIHTYKDLIVWQKSMDLVTEIYLLTAQFPKEELYGLVSQMRRATVALPSNIAEGRRRGTKKEYAQFLRIAYGSGSELETQIEICKRLPVMQQFNYQKGDSLLDEVMRMLHIMIKKLSDIQNT